VSREKFILNVSHRAKSFSQKQQPRNSGTLGKKTERTDQGIYKKILSRDPVPLNQPAYTVSSSL
jgi:hypothetical protein